MVQAALAVGLAWGLLHCGGEVNRNTAFATRADHRIFDISDGGQHGNLDCNACHGAFDSFKQFSCTGCHDHDQPSMDATHLGITLAYVWTPTACYGCHAAGTHLTFNHTPFPIRSGDVHRNINCGTCHTQPTTRTVVNCLSCHPPSPTDGLHAAVGGYLQDSDQCVRCHADSQLKRVADHVPFSLLSGTKHYRIACYLCHDQVRTDKRLAIDFGPYNCLSCHPKTQIEPQHLAFKGYAYVSTTCTQGGCHANGLRPPLPLPSIQGARGTFERVWDAATAR